MKIVVCNDERHIVHLLKVSLERQGHEVHPVYDGLDCLNKVHEVWPDLLVLDRQMPGMGGEEVLAELRRHPDTRDLKVVFLDENHDDDDSFPGSSLRRFFSSGG
ncbi:response regulator [Fimbriimonas ginsengisoli]|uniref:response regulator n=1 Tax=Fimbriimonas ginsengisoli TaxID=1005039 RepID=UPI0003E95CF4|nr:response regulator [Fimbriimonas ginsengisoli]